DVAIVSRAKRRGLRHDHLETATHARRRQCDVEQHDDGDARHPHQRDRRRLRARHAAGRRAHASAVRIAARWRFGRARRDARQFRRDAYAGSVGRGGGRSRYQRQSCARREIRHGYRHRACAASGPQHAGVGNSHRGRARQTRVHLAADDGGDSEPSRGVTTPYANLSPDAVLAAVEAAGVRTDGRLLALNSFENRVYQVGVEDAAPLIAKFYRGGRWSDAAIEEEHAFAQELVDAELPVVAPLTFANSTLLHFEQFRFALYPRQGGRAPELESA